MLYRHFYRWSSSDALLKLYLSQIRPHLEYAVQVWNPYLLKDIKKLETVQKFALRMCVKRWSSSYEELLSESDIPRLVDRRRFLCLMYFYKAINGHITTIDNNIIVTHHCSYNTRSSSQTTSHQPFAHSNMYRNSFFPSTISLWNVLPDSVTGTHSVLLFKRALLNHL